MPSPIYRLLRWSERYTKTDMVYLASGGFWLALGHGVQILFGIGLLIAFANLLPKEIYGTYQFVIALAGVAGICTLTGMGTALLRSAARGTPGSLRHAVRTKFVWNIGIVIVAGAIASYYYYKGNATLGTAFLIVGAFQPLISGFELYHHYLLGNRYFREGALWDSVRKALPAVTLLVTLLFSDNLLHILLTYFASSSLACFLAYRYTIKKYAPEHAHDTDLISYSKHLTAMNVIGQTAQHLDKVLVWHFLGAAPLAAYALAQSAAKQLTKLFTLMHSLTFPKVVQKSVTDLKRILPDKIRRYFVLVTFVVAAYVLAAPLLFKVAFPIYPEAVAYTQLLALSALAVPRQLIWQALEAHKRTREQYILKITAPAIRITMLVLLLPLYGVWGAIAAILTTEICTTVIQWCLFSQMHSREET